MSKPNVLGLSFGRRMATCEILMKEALFGAESAGARISYIRMIDKEIRRCIGCGACGEGMDRGKQIRCILKDDFGFVMDKILDADAVILAAPVYVLTPPGQLLNLIHRMGPAHDMAKLRLEVKRREKAGIEPLDPRALKQRYTGYISVGGASTENWVSFGLPLLHTFGMSMLMKTADHMNVFGYRHHGNPVLCDELMQRARKLGENVEKSIGRDPETLAWHGDDEGICPVCHNNLLSIKTTTTVECPICGIAGELTIENGRPKVVFSEAEQKRARFTEAGLYEHYCEINRITQEAIASLNQNKDRLPGLLERYQKFQPTER